MEMLDLMIHFFLASIHASPNHLSISFCGKYTSVQEMQQHDTSNGIIVHIMTHNDNNRFLFLWPLNQTSHNQETLSQLYANFGVVLGLVTPILCPILYHSKV